MYIMLKYWYNIGERIWEVEYLRCFMKPFKINKFFLTLLILVLYSVSLILLNRFTSIGLSDYVMISLMAIIGLITIHTNVILGLFVTFTITLGYGVLVLLSGTTDILEPIGISYYYLFVPTLIALLTGIMNISNKRYLRLSDSFETSYNELVRIDELTGFRNQTDYIENLEEEINRTNRYGQELTLMLIHIESFNDLNNLYGVHQGNRFLKYLSEYVVELTRNVDKHYRVSDNLFAIILPNTGKEGTTILKERFIEELESLNIVIKSNNQKVDIDIDIVFEEYKETQLDAKGYHKLVLDHLVVQPRGEM